MSLLTSRKISGKIGDVAATEAQSSVRDQVDDWLAEIGGDLPGVDLEVEGIVNRIQLLAKRLKSSMEETLAEHGLSHGEFQVLSTLEWAGPPYRSTPGRLAKRADLSSGAMTNRLDGLERAGLIRRLPDPDDRRGILVEMTGEGRKRWKAALAAQGAKESLVASTLDAREKETLTALLRRLTLAFEGERVGTAKPS
jgi:DNA-binding MarR family transcriptional regulator